MFDIGFSQLMVIGVVALVVIGPEKLPRVARMAGALLGRAQKYVGDLKNEVAQQMNVDEINEMRKTVEEAAKSAQASLKEAESAFTKNIKDVESSVSKSIHETSQEVESIWSDDQAKKSFTAADPPIGKLENLSPASEDIQEKLRNLRIERPAAGTEHPPRVYSTTSNTKKGASLLGVNEQRVGGGQAQWRSHRGAAPLWYKRRTRVKGALQSNAARQVQATFKTEKAPKKT